MGEALDDFLSDMERGEEMTRFMRREEDEGYELGRAKVLHISEKALRVEVLEGPQQGLGAEGAEAFWVPKSQIHSSSQVDDTTLLDEEGTLVTSLWWARQRGFAA
jgi:hypothetical protein